MPGLGEVIALLQLIYAQTVTLLTTLGVIQVQTVKAAQENVPFHIESQVDLIEGQASATNTAVLDPVAGLAAIKAELDSIEAQIAAVQTNILTAVGTPQQAGTAVTLPTYPPTTWVDSITTSTAAQVWFYPDFDGTAYGDDLHQMKIQVNNQSQGYSQRRAGQPYLLLYSQVAWTDLDEQDAFPYPPLNAATILESDPDPTSWVSRAYNGYNWVALNIQNTTVTAYQDQNVSSMFWVLDLTQQEFEALKPQTNTLHLAPVWPGFDLITKLTPITIDSGGTVTEQCHGVLITLNDWPGRLGTFSYGTILSVRNVGSLAFWNDDGWDEHYQVAGFVTMVLMPTTMTIAEGFDYRWTDGVVGTMVPFLIN